MRAVPRPETPAHFRADADIATSVARGHDVVESLVDTHNGDDLARALDLKALRVLRDGGSLEDAVAATPRPLGCVDPHIRVVRPPEPTTGRWEVLSVAVVAASVDRRTRTADWNVVLQNVEGGDPVVATMRRPIDAAPISRAAMVTGDVRDGVLYPTGGDA